MSIITPPPYGRPDYSAPQMVYDGPPLIDDQTGNVDLNPGWGPFDVSSWYGIVIDCLFEGGTYPAAQLLLSWSVDEAGAVEVGDMQLNCGNGAAPYWHGFFTPNIAKWLRVAIQGNAGDNPTYRLTVSPTGRITTPGSVSQQPLQIGLSRVVAPNATATLIPQYVLCGKTIVSFLSTENGSLEFFQATATNPPYTSFPLPSLAAGVQQTFSWQMPVSQSWFTYTNTSASNATVDAIMLTSPPGTQ